MGIEGFFIRDKATSCDRRTLSRVSVGDDGESVSGSNKRTNVQSDLAKVRIAAARPPLRIHRTLFVTVHAPARASTRPLPALGR